jgi:hypothetical protein
MRKLLTWILVTVGIAALVRKLSHRGEAAPEAAWEPTSAEPGATESPSVDPADELRQKLAETRSGEPGSTEEAEEGSVEERRAEVHDQARAAIDEMQPPSES